jgi:hypothetical protein
MADQNTKVFGYEIGVKTDKARKDLFATEKAFINLAERAGSLSLKLSGLGGIIGSLSFGALINQAYSLIETTSGWGDELTTVSGELGNVNGLLKNMGGGKFASMAAVRSATAALGEIGIAASNSSEKGMTE